MNVCVIGMGKIGIPLAVQFASKGARVTGYDIDAARVADLHAHRNPLPAEPGLEEAIPRLAALGLLRATSDPCAAAAAADVVVFIVPVDIDIAHKPDFTLLDAAVDAISPHIRGGTLVLVETTVPVGTTRRRIGPRLPHAAVAFSPERVSSGSVLRDLATYPKIVGGIDAGSTERARAFYAAMLDAPVLVVRDAETAEFSKLAETTYRDVNIALANEFARIADAAGVDALEAIAAANTQPYSHIHRPGPGVGGHCIPVYPYFLDPAETGLIAGARRTNDAMAAYAVARLAGVLGGLDGAVCVVLGLAYRAGVKESRHSSTFGLVDALAAAGATACVHDPLYSADEIRAEGLTPAPAFPVPADALVVQAWHAQYHDLDFRQFAGLRAVLDTRSALDPAAVRSLGLHYVGIGR